MMKLLMSAVAAVLSFGVFAADWEYAEWLANGTGNWSSPARWKDGKLPADTGNVKITNCDAWATDEDVEIIAKLTRIRFSGKASLDLRFDEDHENMYIHTLQNLDGSGNFSRLIKSGSGTLSFDPDRATSIKPDRLIVTNGTLIVTRPVSTMVYGAYEPGLLAFDASTINIGGLEGSGPVTNVTGKQLGFCGGTRTAPHVFEGTLLKGSEPSLDGGYQNLLNPTNPHSFTVRFYDGMFGLSRLGKIGQPGSLGTTENWWFRGKADSVCGFAYLGEEDETTDHTFQFHKENRTSILDAGAHGGITFNGKWIIDSEIPRMPIIRLEGSNAVPCVVSCTFTDHASNSAYIVKSGTGTWRFAKASRGNLGVIAVEQGTLEYESMAEKGTACSLGSSTRLSERFSGAFQPDRAVTWSYLLGDGTTFGAGAEIPTSLATFSYVGEDALSCQTRQIAVNGAARLLNGEATDFHWTDVTSVGTGEQKLVLDGSGVTNRLSFVSDGADDSVLGLVKAGTGTWRLSGRHAFSGGVEVRGGTLVLNDNNGYRWYRVWLMDTYASEGNVQLGLLALSDKDGVRRNTGLVYRDDCIGDPTALLPGEATVMSAFAESGTGRGPGKLFNAGCSLFSGHNKNTKQPTLGTPSTWVGIVMRLPDDVPAITSYDLMSYGNTSAALNRSPVAWKLEASADGIHWDLMHQVASSRNPPAKGAWYNSGAVIGDGTVVNGYSFTESLQTLASLPYVALSGGGVIKTSEPVAIGDLRIDAKTGGTLEGFAFGESGTLAVDFGADRPAGLKIPGAFTDCTGIENLDTWNLTLNGQPKPGWSVRATEDGITVIPPGVIILVR